MQELTEAEKEVLGDLLDSLSNYMSNAGCNDYHVADPVLQLAIAKFANDDDPDYPVTPKEICNDFTVLEYLRDKLGV